MLSILHQLKSAVFRFQIFECGVCARKSNLNPRKASTSSIWQGRKVNTLSMDAKKEPSGKLKDIPTWGQYAAEESSLPAKIDMKLGCEIDDSKNATLANKISIFCGNITILEVDAIVNAANSSLLGGGGVDGAIHKAAGPNLKAECKTLGGCPTGEAKITGGYNLPAKHVIHTVGPQGEKEGYLKNCYQNSLRIMLENNLRSIAFPCISTGIYGYPNEPAAHVAAYTVRKFLEANSDKVDRIIFCLFLDIDKDIYKGLLQSYFPLE
ncbi:hypothetical protein NQ315_010022 [Exocentrus adspersus]|uniref:Macro domain-containing protein n=1 Tax=Exocentrus adspersus TaxID=1586481 RepID=A0AAV8VK25_9CUCU|nr:hypothetical protein NQ315_010022 [Exocentrus adspersus]